MATKYTEAIVSIYFEEGHKACAYCPMLETYSRNQCRRTGEYILDTRYGVGQFCPLHFLDEDTGEIENV